MTKKVCLLFFITVATSHIVFADRSPDTQTIGRPDIEFDLNVDGKKLPYRIGHIVLDYVPDNLKVNRNKDSNSADISLAKGFVMLIYGDLIDHLNKETSSEYTFIKNQYLNVKANGSAKLAADGLHVENCKLEWEQISPIYKNQLQDAVRDALVENLDDILDEKLCDSINTVITKFSV